MNRRSLSLLLVLLLVPVVTAGDASDPELTDPDGDASATAGDDCTVDGNDAPDQFCANENTGPGPESASDAGDLLAVWVSDVNDTHFGLHIQTKGAGDADTEYDVAFDILATNSSLPGGSESTSIAFKVEGTTPDPGAPVNTTATRNATDPAILDIIMPRAEAGAVGGDSIQNIVVTVTDDEVVTGGPADASRTDTTTDSSDATSRPYNLTRPPIMGAVSLIVNSASLTQAINGTQNVTTVTDDELTLNATVNGTATATFTMTLTNNGLDPDNVTVSIFDLAGLGARNITATVSPTFVTLDPGQTSPVLLTAALNGTMPGTHTITVQAETGLGGFAVAPATLVVPSPPAPPVDDPEPDTEDEIEEERTPFLGLDALTPAAEALGLIEPFGEYAELVLLAAAVLLLILILFLIIFLATRGAIKVQVEPKRIDIAPGQTAEFHVEVKNKKGKPMDAVASFEGDPEWQTAMVFGGHELNEAGVDAGMHLGPKKEASGARHGTLRVTAPEAAGDKESDRVTLSVAPLKDGRAKGAKHAKVRIRAVAPEAGDVRLAAVDHDPAHPEAGQVVETTARVENDSPDETLHLRVVLNVDGDDLQEQPLALPPQQARAVVFTWQVPAGSSKVRVRIYQDA